MLAANEGGEGRGDKRKKGNDDTGGGNTGDSCSGEGRGADVGVMAVGGLRASDPNTLLNLYASLHDMSGVEIQKKINAYIQDATRANCSLIIQLWKDNKEAVVQVIGATPVEQELRFPIVSNVLETVVSESKCVQAIVSELDQDLFEQLNEQIGNAAVLAVPVKHPNGGVVIIVCLVFSEGQNHTLTDFCQAIVQECFRFCLGTVINTLAYEDEKRLHKQFQTLLLGASNLFSHVGDVGDLMKEIVLEACKLTSAEKCSMFLLDDNGYLVSKIFNNQRCSEEVRLSVGQGIAGHVAETGKLVNIQDAYSHPLFYNAIDKKTGFRTRNILCFPILNKGKVIGVAELCNKKDGFDFDIFDEEVATAFSVYCGISIMHSLVYKKVQDAQARYQLSNELMMYHMKIEDEDVGSMVNCTEDHLTMWEDFYNFSFSTRLLPSKSTAHIAFEMFSELGFTQHFNIKSECLARFILYVKKGYRSTPYHNWDHAMAVFHLACLFIKNLKLIENEHLTWVEGLALIVSAICHDIDHRGTTNQFQMASGTVLASLYSSEGSVMERHHVSQTMCILNTEGCNIVSHLGSAEYRCFIDLISRLILATDLANHFRVVEQQEAMAKDGYDRSNPKHREVFLYLLMTCCDLSDQIKSWEVCRHVTELVYKEFFSQGDLEKSMGTNPSEMMDRDRAKIPDLQIDFIKTVVLPAYRLLSVMFPEETSSCLATIEENLKRWEITEGRFMQQWQQGCSPIDVLKEVCEDNMD